MVRFVLLGLPSKIVFYIDDINWGGGVSKWPKNSKLCILHRIPYLTIRSMLI